jgi:hypothetical protein
VLEPSEDFTSIEQVTFFKGEENAISGQLKLLTISISPAMFAFAVEISGMRPITITPSLV